MDHRDGPFNACCYREQCHADRQEIERLHKKLLEDMATIQSQGDEIERLKGNLSLAEEGLANYHQEALRLHEQIAVLQGERTNYQQDVEQLRKANEKLQTLVIWSVDTMSALHRAIEPMENDPELAGRVPPAAMRAFVDALASIDRERFVPHPTTGPDR